MYSMYYETEPLTKYIISLLINGPVVLRLMERELFSI